jgi:hypothetical protein
VADSISAIPQQPFLGRLAEFLRFLEKDRPEFLPRQLGVMQGMSQLALPQASTIENLSYGNQPFIMPPSGTGAMIPQVKTGRKAEVADLISMISGVPGAGAVADVGTKLSNETADALVRMITRNPQATAPSVIQETTMPFMRSVAPRTPGLLETPVKSDLGFYSALEQATIPLQNKGTGAQFLAQIEKTAGVKPEEVKWTGLDEFLRSRQNVTKQEVQDYLAANRVNIQEVRLGDVLNDPTGTYPYRSADEWSAAVDRAGRARNWDEVDRLHQAWEAAEGYGPAGSTKFSKYTLPGGENYREILLTLPEGSKSPAYKAQKALDDANKAYDADQSFENYQRVLRAREEADKVGADWKSPEFRSSHFDQPNILAHMRVNDRIVDGKKTLFIEEIQSDWHQAGRKRGYKSESLGEQVSDSEYRRAAELQRRQNVLGETLTAEESRDLNEIMTRHTRSVPAAQVPDAPFKTTWHELTLKRAIQEASEKGYDQIAFTTGKTQAERYDLSKQVDKIAITKTGGVWAVNAWKDGSKAITKDAATDADLANLVGKELADKAIKQGGGEYAGLDLQVGGEGMKGFYDNILPKSLEKLGKKFDAKVGKTEMDGVEVWQMDITPKMRESVLTKGQPLFAATPAVGLLGRDEEQ